MSLAEMVLQRHSRRSEARTDASLLPGTLLTGLKLTVLIVVTALGITSVSAKSLCDPEAVADFERICGLKYWESTCRSEAEAKIAIDWVLFKDRGALATFKENVATCGYKPNESRRDTLLGILHAQRHNRPAMCNLLSCARNVYNGYLNDLALWNRIPDAGDRQVAGADTRPEGENDVSDLLKKMRERYGLDGSDLAPPPAQEPPPPPRNPNGLSFSLKNETDRTVHARFFNLGFGSGGTAKGVWPVAGRVYVISPGETEKYDLACKKGERVCYGAEFADGRSSNQSSFFYWGAALSGREGCTSCCGICGDGPYGTRLTHTDRPLPPPASVDAGPGLGDTIGPVLGAIGGIIASQPARRSPPPQMSPPAPRGPQQRPSGISGFR